MPTNKTPCHSKHCQFYVELYSPQPGESWNRCSHKARRLETTLPLRVNTYGYADKLCEHYTPTLLYRFVTFGR